MQISTSRLRMETHDRGLDRNQPPLVLLHPFPLSAGAWQLDAEALASRFRVITPSLRGFGTTSPFDATTPPSIDAMADDVASLLDALDLREPVALGGLSMGGYVALSFARRHSERLGALILADTRAEADDAEARANRDRTIARVASGELADVASGLLSKLLTKKTHATRPDLVLSIRRQMLSASPSAIVDALLAMRDRPDARPVLPTIRVPTLVIVGEEDVVTPGAAADVMARAIPQASLVRLSGVGHLSNLEDPPAFQEAVAAFLSEVNTRRGSSRGTR